MFETVQIARHHMLRFEYPEMVAALDSAAAPTWLGGIADAVSAWFGDGPDGPEDDERGDGEADVDEQDVTLVSVWQAFPYY